MLWGKILKSGNDRIINLDTTQSIFACCCIVALRYSEAMVGNLSKQLIGFSLAASPTNPAHYRRWAEPIMQ